MVSVHVPFIESSIHTCTCLSREVLHVLLDCVVCCPQGSLFVACTVDSEFDTGTLVNVSQKSEGHVSEIKNEVARSTFKMCSNPIVYRNGVSETLRRFAQVANVCGIAGI